MRHDEEFWKSAEVKYVQALVRQYGREPRRRAIERLVPDVHKDAIANKIPARWLDAHATEPQSAQLPYHSRFSDRGVKSALDWAEGLFPGATISAGSGIMGAMLGSFSVIFSAYDAIGAGGSAHLLFGAPFADLAQMMFAMGGAGALALGGLSTAAWLPWKRVSKRRLNIVRKLEAQALRAWLQGRYGVQVEDGQLAELADRVLGNLGEDQPLTLTFLTTSNKELEFTTEDNHGICWSVREPKQLTAAGKKRAIAASSSEEIGLHGEAAVLYSAVVKRLGQLEAQDLSVEQHHVLARAREDLSNTASLVRKMLSLDPMSQVQEAKVTGVLSALMNEVRQLQEQLQADIDRDLDVQAEYIRSRGELSGSGRLALPPAQAAPAAQQQEEVQT